MYSDNKELATLEEVYNDLSKVLDLSYDGVTITNSNGKIIYANKSIERLFGANQEQILGEDPANLQKSGILDVNVTWQVITSEKEVTVKQKTAANRIVLVTGIPIFNHNNNLEKVINISRDITEADNLSSKINSIQSELAWYKNELRKRNKIKDQNIFNNSSPMHKVMDVVYHIANFDTTVLILGETGVGKGFITRKLHDISERSSHPFVSINCGAIPVNLLEAELFGYEKGSFTGASENGKKGLFEVAGKGTIFLDEIGEMPLTSQVKLLHTLDDKKALRINGTKTYPIEARIVAATNKNLKTLVMEGKFREDLYYRLNVVPLTVPSLRQRKEDLAPLINTFLNKFNEKYKTVKYFSEDALKLLHNYNFPGNIRELQNIIERLVITVIDDEIKTESLQSIIEFVDRDEGVKTDLMPLKQATEELERRLIINALSKYKTTRKAAEILKIDQSTVVKKAKKYNIEL